MALRFLADHCVPKSVVETLRNEKHEVIWLKDVLPPESEDSAVIAKAQELESVLVSLNGDFADIAAYPPREYKGIVAIRMRNHVEILPHILARLNAYLKEHSEMGHYEGKLFIVEAGRIRIRA